MPAVGNSGRAASDVAHIIRVPGHADLRIKTEGPDAGADRSRQVESRAIDQHARAGPLGTIVDKEFFQEREADMAIKATPDVNAELILGRPRIGIGLAEDNVPAPGQSILGNS